MRVKLLSRFLSTLIVDSERHQSLRKLRVASRLICNHNHASIDIKSEKSERFTITL